MFIEISLIVIATALVVAKILRKKKSLDKNTQTELGLWLPQIPMYFEDTSGSVSTSSDDISILEMEVVKGYDTLKSQTGLKRSNDNCRAN